MVKRLGVLETIVWSEMSDNVSRIGDIEAANQADICVGARAI